MRRRTGDPGAVEIAGMGLELAVAEEIRRIVDGLPGGAAGAADFARSAWPDRMQVPPEERNEVDETLDEAFPASNLPARGRPSRQPTAVPRLGRHPLWPRPRRFLRRDRATPDLAMASHGHERWLSAGQCRQPGDQHLLRWALSRATYIFVVLGLIALWRTAHRAHLWWSWKLLAGTMLIGFGVFNVVEGVIDHHLLGLHHVNETGPREQWIYWDVGFLIWGAGMILGGWALYRSGQGTMPGGSRRSAKLSTASSRSGRPR